MLHRYCFAALLCRAIRSMLHPVPEVSQDRAVGPVIAAACVG